MVLQLSSSGECEMEVACLLQACDNDKDQSSPLGIEPQTFGSID